jgi:hypothetical protein
LCSSIDPLICPSICHVIYMNTRSFELYHIVAIPAVVLVFYMYRTHSLSVSVHHGNSSVIVSTLISVGTSANLPIITFTTAVAHPLEVKDLIDMHPFNKIPIRQVPKEKCCARHTLRTIMKDLGSPDWIANGLAVWFGESSSFSRIHPKP